MQVNNNMQYRRMISGIGGWLLILVLCMLLVWPLMALSATAASLDNFDGVAMQSRLLMWLIFAVSALASVFSGWQLLRVHTKDAVSLAKLGIWFAWPVMSLVMVVAAQMILQDPRAGDAYTPLLWHFMLSLAGAIVATLYLKRSVRVINTYRLPLSV